MRHESPAALVLFASDVERVASFYAAVLGLADVSRDEDHCLLESPAFQLAVHRIVGGGVARDEPGAPPARRASAAFKPVFFVPSLSQLRAIVEAHGGAMEPANREWSFQGATVCDGLDPEGNVIQFREPAG